LRKSETRERERERERERGTAGEREYHESSKKRVREISSLRFCLVRDTWAGASLTRELGGLSTRILQADFSGFPAGESIDMNFCECR